MHPGTELDLILIKYMDLLTSLQTQPTI